MLDNLILGLTAALGLKQFFFMVVGTVIGLWVGVLPGLGGPVAMAILIPFTFSMDPLSSLLMLGVDLGRRCLRRFGDVHPAQYPRRSVIRGHRV
jgi:TctA family transporter